MIRPDAGELSCRVLTTLPLFTGTGELVGQFDVALFQLYVANRMPRSVAGAFCNG